MISQKPAGIGIPIGTSSDENCGRHQVAIAVMNPTRVGMAIDRFNDGPPDGSA
jgi:hypothetical protein